MTYERKQAHSRFRNVTGIVDPIAAVNNYLLPLWMVIFGVALQRHSPAILIRQPI